MVGVIAGELAMGLFWIAVGALYFLNTGYSGAVYAIF